MPPDVSSFKLQDFTTKCILYYAITDTKFLRYVRPIVDPDILLGDFAPQLLRLIYRFYDKDSSQVAPDNLFQEEFEFALNTGQFPKNYEMQARLLLSQLSQWNPEQAGLNTGRVINMAVKLSRQRKLTRLAGQLSNYAASAKFEEADRAMMDILKLSTNGHREDLPFISREERDRRFFQSSEKTDYLMPFGIDPFDKSGAYLRRKLFMIIMGPEKRGKTWSGVHFGKIALLNGLKVVHISQGDLPEERLQERYEMAIGGLGAAFRDRQKNWVHKKPFFREEKETGTDGKEKIKYRLDWKEVKPETVIDRKKVDKHVQAIAAYGGDLRIKFYPRGSCTMRVMEGYLNQLELVHEFIPDVIINDYPDIMRLPQSDAYRHGLDEIYQDHDRIAKERNCLVIGFSQVKAKAYESKKITMADFAEDKRKAAHCDLALALCQTGQEKLINRLRLVWVLDRYFGSEGKQAALLYDFHLGQFCKKSYWMRQVAEGGEAPPPLAEED